MEVDPRKHSPAVSDQEKRTHKKRGDRSKRKIRDIVYPTKPRREIETDLQQPAKTSRRVAKLRKVRPPEEEVLPSQPDVPPTETGVPANSIEVRSLFSTFRVTTNPYDAPGVRAASKESGDNPENGRSTKPKLWTPARAYIETAREQTRIAAMMERDLVASHESPWKVYGTSAKFHEFLMETSTGIVSKDARDTEMDFNKLRESRLPEEGPALAMDVMGQGGFEGADAEVAVTLIDFRPEEIRQSDTQAGKEVVPGDVLDPVTWRNVREFIDKNESDIEPEERGIAVAICNPIGGWGAVQKIEEDNIIPHDPLAVLTEWITINRMYHTLRRGRMRPAGTLYVQRSGAGDYDTWLETLLNTPGIHAVMDDKISSKTRYVRISNISGETKNLPFLPPRY